MRRHHIHIMLEAIWAHVLFVAPRLHGVSRDCASLSNMAKSFARFTPFQRGRIVGQAEAGASRSNIRRTCRKKDGQSANMRAIDAIIARRRDSDYQGEDSSAGCRIVCGPVCGLLFIVCGYSLWLSLRVVCGLVCG